ncbi:MAG: hypothetical protein PHC90_00060 [Syntrophorhabdaceae bacterium]|nr:hypothetical protein [Syntrophorhabdaceae bacterium]
MPDDRWHDPYMARLKLQHEIGDGVVFYGYQEDSTLAGLAGIRDRDDVSLIRQSSSACVIMARWHRRGRPRFHHRR